MTNPLARVVMENIVKKSNEENTEKDYDYLKTVDRNKTRDITFKSLDKVADEIRGFKSDNDSNRERNSMKTISTSNLSLSEESLLSSIIKGNINTPKGRLNIKTKEFNKTSPVKNNTLSLDRLAKNIKNNI